MKIYKFGGASLKNAEAIIGLGKLILSKHDRPLVVIVSAMGKMTNAFEEMVNAYFKNRNHLIKTLHLIKQYHGSIVNELFDTPQIELETILKNLYSEIHFFFQNELHNDHAYVYDQTVVYGELISSHIIFYYLKSIDIKVNLIDSRNCIKTDSYYRDANVDWKKTVDLINHHVDSDYMTLAQGFIAGDLKGNSTTLGREGSDYTAAIYGYALDAKSVTVWKDVRGILNANPKIFEPTVLINEISYREAIELAYYGASVIHPKTIQPVQRKKIPFYVKSFKYPHKAGTKIGLGHKIQPKVSCFIKKEKLVLLKISTLDFSFMIEKNISEVFGLLYQYQMKVELTQNSAISYSVCFYNKYQRLVELISVLKQKFKVIVNRNVTLYTIRHFNQEAIDRVTGNGKKVLLEQRGQETVHFVCV
ncbi:MAG: aspartate kinase [Flavobacteriaceae bacterium]|nr:aspartate kinase [Flavobacteriaceae bacterium]MCY4267482.1 aspartate kinase [Flavobacteriaceae bacterium]MCY4298294.1 aspartate kinase [Flavobacteriaceae bacterium]